MVSAKAREAYGGSGAGLNLRWGTGFGLVLLCGLLIAWVTGAGRSTGRERLAAQVISFAAPLLVMIGMLALAY